MLRAPHERGSHQTEEPLPPGVWASAGHAIASFTTYARRSRRRSAERHVSSRERSAAAMASRTHTARTHEALTTAQTQLEDRAARTTRLYCDGATVRYRAQILARAESLVVGAVYVRVVYMCAVAVCRSPVCHSRLCVFRLHCLWCLWRGGAVGGWSRRHVALACLARRLLLSRRLHVCLVGASCIVGRVRSLTLAAQRK
jgi:hypothetical protein